jgi:hypothetical protein
VAVDAYFPLGQVTRRINAPLNCCNTFILSTNDTNTVTLTEAGFYKVTYSLTAEAAAEGILTIGLVSNGTTVYTVSEAIAAADSPVNVTLPYTIRVSPNCASSPANAPISIQIQNTGIALTGSSSNLIIEKL